MGEVVNFPPLRLVDSGALPSCYVYFVKQLRTRPVLLKIGKTSDLKRRLMDLTTGSGLELRLMAAVPGARALESALHAEFDYLRTRGEWFEVDAALRARIDELWRGAGQHRVPRPTRSGHTSVWRM